MMRRFNFYGFTGRKNGKCVVCGKPGQLQKRFKQSINPWNEKTPRQIYDEEDPKLKEWQALPFKHIKCESSLVPEGNK